MQTPAAGQGKQATPQTPHQTPQTTPPAAGQAPAQPGAAPAPAAQAGPPVKPVPATLPDLVAKIDTETISKAELERAIKSVEARVGRSVPPDQRDRVYRQVLDELVNLRLIAHEGKARNIPVADTDVDTQIGKLRQQFKTEDEFKAALQQRSLTLDDVKTETRTEILVNKTLEAEILPKVSIAQADLDAYYKANPDQFKSPERVRASHILIPVNSSMTEAQKTEARTQAEGILKRARAGEDFATLAKQYSKDATAQSGGDLNFFERGRMLPAFDQAAFALKTGDVSNVVETQYGFHIIKVTDHQDARTVPLPEISDRLSDFLKQRKQQELTQSFIQQLHSKYKIEILI